MHIHKWEKWKTVRKEVIEHNYGLLIPYHIQERECKKCGKFQVSISNIKSVDFRFE